MSWGEFLRQKAKGVIILRDRARCCRGVKSWITPIPKRRSGMGRKKRNDPKKKRRERAIPAEVELDLSGESPRGNMSRSSLEG